MCNRKETYIWILQKLFRSNSTWEKINKIAFSSNDNKRIQQIDSTETYAHRMIKDLVIQQIKCNDVMRWYKNVYLWWWYKGKHRGI